MYLEILEVPGYEEQGYLTFILLLSFDLHEKKL